MVVMVVGMVLVVVVGGDQLVPYSLPFISGCVSLVLPQQGSPNYVISRACTLFFCGVIDFSNIVFFLSKPFVTV